MRLFVVALLFFVLSPVQGYNQPKPADNPAHPQPDQKTAQPSPTVTQPTSGDHGDNKSGQSKSEPQNSSLLDYLGVFLTIVIALAACVQAGVSVWQARVYERQYEAMNKQVVASNQSAEAALKGVAVLEKLERPFLMVELRGADSFKDEVWLVNKGKIPAQILWYNPSGSLRMHTREEMEEMPPPEKFNYGYLHDQDSAQVINVPWIAPEGEMKLTIFDWISLADELKHFETKQKFAFLLSTVKYRGMLNETIFESRWCCRWFGKNFGGLRLDGPYGYNKYT